jgi:hypothetical protein
MGWRLYRSLSCAPFSLLHCLSIRKFIASFSTTGDAELTVHGLIRYIHTNELDFTYFGYGKGKLVEQSQTLLFHFTFPRTPVT